MAKVNVPDSAIEYEDSDIVDEGVNPGRSNWLIPLLLVPIFFVLGWVANDFAQTNPVDPQYGIGAGPDTQVWPSPTPMSWIPTDTPEETIPVITSEPSVDGSTDVTY